MSDRTTAPDAELRRRLAAPAADWVAAAGAAAGGHPDVDALIAYHGGGLDEDEQRRVQDHLVTCRDCLDHLLELEEFAGPVAAAGERAEGEVVQGGEPGRSATATAAADFETAAAWRAMRSRLPAAPSRLPRWAAAVAAALAVAVFGLAFFALDRHREADELSRRVAELSRPQLGVPIVDPPAPVVRGAGEAPQVLELPATGYAMLILSLPILERPESGAYDRYTVEILDSADRLLWSGDRDEASAGGTVTLVLPGGFLTPGDYSLRLYGFDGEERHWIESHTVRVPGS